MDQTTWESRGSLPRRWAEGQGGCPSLGSIPACSWPQGAGCPLGGGTPSLGAERPQHAPLIVSLRGTCMEPVLPSCYPHLEQQSSTNSSGLTKPLGEAIRQINERKAPIKDYQTPSPPGEGPGAIHFYSLEPGNNNMGLPQRSQSQTPTALGSQPVFNNTSLGY